MKNFTIFLIAAILCIPTSGILSDEEPDWRKQEQKEIPEGMKFYKEKYEEVFDAPFEDVWEAILSSVEERNCMVIRKNTRQTDEGFFKGSIHSDFCVFATATAEEKVQDSLKKYSLRVPFIRGGVFINGRMQYKFVVSEQEDGTVRVLLKGEVSGFEEHVTGQVHFWESNGYLETRMMENIRRKLQA
ncbi:MAG: hypothetical protein ACOC2K_02585 [Bacteroidota bacterium]